MADVLQIQNRGNVDLNYHRSRVRHLSSSSGHELDEEDLDPRIQDELEKLNKGSDEINRLELELDEARSSFRQSLSDSTQKLNVLTKKLGSCIEKARPYYDARMRAKEAQVETQRAALRFERAMSMHEAAKEMVQLAEQGYSNKGEEFDPAWQEMLNHATMKVNEAEKERIESEQEHALTAKFYNESDQKVQTLQKDLKRAITKSRPYFEMKAKFNQLMEEQKQMVAKLEAQVVGAKSMYSEALRNLERISDEIHQQRMEKRKHKELGIRGSGVGADSPPPPRRELGGKMDGSDIIDTECHSDTSPESFRNSADLTSSLVYSSPESARNNSYRQAIDASMSASSNYRITSPAADLDDNFDVPSLEEEYMGLPGMRPSRHSLSRSPITEGEDSVFSPLPNTHVTSRRDIVREVANSSPTSSTGSPASVRKSKLQGIILKIDSKMDSGLRHPSFNKPQRTQSMYVTAPQYYKGFNSKSGKRSADASQTENNRDQAKEGAVSTGPSPIPAPVACPAKRQVKLSLPRPSSNHDIEDTSDTESIASTGPMPDDELVEMATLDLPDEEELQQEEEEFKQSFDRDSWKRRSLPPHLNYLAQYLKDEHVGSTEAAQKQTDADLSDDRLTQEKLGLQESRD